MIINILDIMKYNMYIFEKIKLKIKTFLSCIECRHSCAIVWILVKLPCIFPKYILSCSAIYNVESDSIFSSICVFSFSIFFNISLQISILSGYFSEILFNSLSIAILFNFLILIGIKSIITTLEISALIIISIIFNYYLSFIIKIS